MTDSISDEGQIPSFSSRVPVVLIDEEEKVKEMDVDKEVSETSKQGEDRDEVLEVVVEENNDDENDDSDSNSDIDIDDDEEDGEEAHFVSVYSGHGQPYLKNQSKEFFAVRKGRSTSSCIFLIENDFKEQIHNFTTAEYAKFSTMHEAMQYIESDPLFVVKSSTSSKKRNNTNNNTDRVTDTGTTEQCPKAKESWEGMFIQLMYYHRSHNNTFVPSDCQPLYSWVIDQLKQYDQLKKGLPHTLTKGRVQLLLGLSFDFDREIPLTNVYINEENDDGAELIVANEETDVPILRSKNYTSSHTGITNSQNSTVAMTTATTQLPHQFPHSSLSPPYHVPNFTTNMQSPMNFPTNNLMASSITNTSVPVYQYQHLFTPYFSNFNAPTQCPINNVPTNSVVYQSSNTSPNRRESLWNDKFAELLKFKVEHGHLNVDDASDLGKWCERQKEVYKVYKKNGTGPLTEDKVRRLKDLGFDLMSKSEKKFYAAIEELKKHKEEHGNFCVPTKEQKLYKLLRGQKSVVSIVKRLLKHIICLLMYIPVLTSGISLDSQLRARERKGRLYSQRLDRRKDQSIQKYRF